MYSTSLPLILPALEPTHRTSLLKEKSLMSLYEVFGTVADPRSSHGLRYDLPFLLTCLVAALLCNCNSCEAIGQWCRDQRVLLTRLFGSRRFLTPTGSLYRRLLPRLKVDELEEALCAWVSASRPRDDEEPIALDGKTLRGAKGADKKGPHLLSFCTHESQETLFQVRVSKKTNEIPVAKQSLPKLPVRHRVYTADALHTHAAFLDLVEKLEGATVLTVKGNQPTLYADLATYFTDPATRFAAYQQDETIDRKRGRVERRSIRVTTHMNRFLAPTWPHVQQVAELTRYVTHKGKSSTQVVYLLTDLTDIQASPRRLLDLIRGHWSIENRLHYVRDVTFVEDRSQLRTGSAPQIMAALRNLTITLIHRTGSSQIAATRRHFANHPGEAFRLLLQRCPSQQ